MLNEKMTKVANTIERIIMMIFPHEYLSIVLDNDMFTISDIVNTILVECCYSAYNSVTEKHSLLYYIKEQNENPDTEESERKQIERTLKTINKHRDSFYNQLLEYGINIDGLKSPDMNTLAQKMEGYSFTPFQFWEITDVHDNELISSIIEKSIYKKNHFTNESFRQSEREYDQLLANALHGIETNIDVVENFLKVFILEDKYSFDFYYYISQSLLQNKLEPTKEISDRLFEFSGTSTISSAGINTGASVLAHIYPACQNRLLTIRPKYTHIITMSTEEEFSRTVLSYHEARYIVAEIVAWMTYQGIPITQWFEKHTDEEDWKSVFLHYDIQRVINLNKDLSNSKTIRNIKKLYQIAQNPDFRPMKN